MGSWRIQCGMACFVDDQRMVVISRKCYVIQKTCFCYRMDENGGGEGWVLNNGLFDGWLRIMSTWLRLIRYSRKDLSLFWNGWIYSIACLQNAPFGRWLTNVLIWLAMWHFCLWRYSSINTLSRNGVIKDVSGGSLRRHGCAFCRRMMIMMIHSNCRISKLWGNVCLSSVKQRCLWTGSQLPFWYFSLKVY